MKKFSCSTTAPVVSTKYGLLRGYQYGDMFYFKGIKYADSKRFEMPVEVQPWEGIREAQVYGYCSSVLSPYVMDKNIIVPHRYWLDSEDCQYLNIWSTELSKEAKKPVMVWIHGGGYENGSSIEHVDYEGENLARNGDVVVVSINHRLNIIGYLDLSSFDDGKYHNSGNVGNADIVASLKWIKENIAAFGGDPDNVTIFGQSGGGGKVANLLQTPAAAGLFHKAIIESGAWGEKNPKIMDGHAVAVAILEYLGMKEEDYLKLTEISYRELADAYNAVKEKLEKDGVDLFWQPTPNDWYLGKMEDVGICEHAKHIPLMMGSVFGEFMSQYEPEPEKLSEDKQRAIVEKVFGEHTDEVIEAFREAYPEKPICYAVTVDSIFRIPTMRYVEEWARQSESPVYNWMLTYCFDYMGTYPAWHCSEIPFVMHNIDLVEVYGCEECGKLQEEINGAWVSFAKTGDPNHEKLPEWPAFDPQTGAVMIFDRDTQVRKHHDQKLMNLLEQYGTTYIPDVFSEDEDENAVAHPY
ncbi:MAG: carboxylesterase/lipase family protein [Clostridia bacterium]|nr:carboxylesterase/lipase family protein [Clostridia bacterium]NCC44079.1 carboxylesterase/lipase family protein [Clostridia bacterium]